MVIELGVRTDQRSRIGKDLSSIKNAGLGGKFTVFVILVTFKNSGTQ
jgi:hypothetical protein